tara:strand:- start:353 stop:547 length:195 start_codon:yes stop_codon:yes gene_type:complete
MYLPWSSAHAKKYVSGYMGLVAHLYIITAIIGYVRIFFQPKKMRYTIACSRVTLAKQRGMLAIT